MAIIWMGVLLGLGVAVVAEMRAFNPTSMPQSILVAAVLQVLPLCLLGRSPLFTWRFMTLGVAWVAFASPGASTAWPWSVTALVLYAVVLVMVAERSEGPQLLGVWVWSVAALWISGLGASIWLLAALAAVVAALLGIGYLLRSRADARTELARAAAELDTQVTQSAVLAERARVARELHDVVAHHMSMIAVQAQAAPLRNPDLPPQAVRTFALISDAAKEALAETRGIVSLLRGEDAQNELEPAPSLERLDDLIAGARGAGMHITFTSSVRNEDIGPAHALTVYRMLQEALANAARHAPGAPVEVHLTARDGELELVVRNGPPPTAAQDGEQP
jgi:signal transduction histidine kinase